jgi:hypothetical protein
MLMRVTFASCVASSGNITRQSRGISDAAIHQLIVRAPGRWGAAERGRVIATTDHLGLLSGIVLFSRSQLNGFQEAAGLYPLHLSALFEAAPVEVEIAFSNRWRMLLDSFHYPAWLVR